MERLTCMFTGHRQIPANDIVRLPQKLDTLLESLIQDGFADFRCGGAMGFDTIAALKVIEKKQKYPYIKLHLCLPCRDQAKNWSESARRAYDMVLQAADSISYESEIYRSGCMHARNRRMVDGSDLCVTYCTSSQGGTAYTVLYARQHGVKIHFIDFGDNRQK